MKRKTIKHLMSSKNVVYVRLSSKAVAEVFFALAKFEGFTPSQAVLQRGLPEDEVDKLPGTTTVLFSGYKNYFVRLNEDMTISFPTYNSWAGAIAFHNAKFEHGKKVVKIDFEKMLRK